jgi:hypothetical protein
MIDVQTRAQLERFAATLEADLRREFPRLREQYDDHHFYVVGLYTTPLYEYFAPVGNSEEALTEEQLRWVPGEWQCRLDSLLGMDASNDVLSSLLAMIPDADELAFLEGELKDLVFSVLSGLRDQGVLDAFGDRGSLLINVVTPDDEEESWIADAMRLNQPEVWEPMAEHLRGYPA